MSNADRLEQIVNQNVAFFGNSPIPAIVEVSLTDQCNLKCQFCPHVDEDYYNNPVFMDEKVIDRLASELKRIGFRGLVVFSGYGEPTLHPKLYQFVQKLSDFAQVDVVTNGVLLDEKILSKLLLAGINKILVSAYSEKVEERVTKLFGELPFLRYEIRPRYKMDFKLTNRAGAINDQFGNRNPCWYLTYCLMLDQNGDVMLCPQDFNRHVRFGNILTRPIEEIWDSEYINKYRMQLIESRCGLSPCKKCDVDGTVHGQTHAKLWKLCKS